MSELNAERAKRWLAEAEGYLELGLLDAARERVDVIAQTPHFPLECALLKGGILREQQRFDEAVPCFQAVLKHEAGHISATFGLGWCLKRLGRPAEAARAYEAALRHHPGEALLHYNLACYRSLAGDLDGALTALARAIEMDSDFRDMSKEEPDFEALRDLDAFRKLLREEAEDERRDEG